MSTLPLRTPTTVGADVDPTPVVSAAIIEKFGAFVLRTHSHISGRRGSGKCNDGNRA